MYLKIVFEINPLMLKGTFVTMPLIASVIKTNYKNNMRVFYLHFSN